MVLLFAYRSDIFAGVPEADIKAFAGDILNYLSKNLSAVRDTVNSSGALSDENAERMKTALTNFKENSAYGKHQ